MLYMAATRSILLLMVISVTASYAEAARPSRRPARQTPTAPTEAVNDGLQEIVTDEYVIRTDLPEADLPPVVHRLRALAGEYDKRTHELSDRSDDRRLPFHLYSDLEAYTAAGGTPGSAGIFDGERLLAFVGRRADARAWHTIQHEAFHQYLGAKLGYEIPIWLNEGLAEYFGESLFTGDGFVSGLVPPWRLKRIRESIEGERFISLRELLQTSHAQWNEALNQENYDLAWSVVHFLAHGDGGRYQDALTNYIKESGRGADPVRAFEQAIGPLPEVEEAWVAYWRDVPEDEVRLTYAEVAVKTVCSFLGRAAAMRSKPGDPEELMTMAREGELPQPPEQELPLDLLIECLAWSRELGEWKFDHNQRAEANVTLKLKDRTLVQGTYAARPGRFHQVDAWTSQPQTAPVSRKRDGRRP